MTATIGTNLNIYSGLREFSNVTNTYAGYLQSGGVAYDIVLPWQADKFEWHNSTKFATDDSNCQGVWFRDFSDSEALIIRRGTTDLTSVLEAANGITISNIPGGFTDQHNIITGITTASPAIVTSADHGLTTGQRVTITKVIGTMAQEINNKNYVVDVLSSSTFALYDVFGKPITIAGSYTSSGMATLTGPELGTSNIPITYRLNLDSAVMANDDDIIHFVATKFNSYFNLGDVA